MAISIDNITHDQRNTLMYAETCAVDWGGLLDGERMNREDFDNLKTFSEEGLLTFGRIPGELLGKYKRKATHWCDLTEAGWDLAFKLRRSRAAMKEPTREEVNAVMRGNAEA